jgi:hypothetical protein
MSCFDPALDLDKLLIGLEIAGVRMGGTGAPTNATYVTQAAEAGLTGSRQLAVDANLTLTDNGAGSTLEVGAIQDIQTTSSPTFEGLTISKSSLPTLILKEGVSQSSILFTASPSPALITGNQFRSPGFTTTSFLRFEETGAGTNYVGFTAPASIAADQLWTMPNTVGSANQVMLTDGASPTGTLSWGNRDEQAIGTTDSPTFQGLTISDTGTPTITLTDPGGPTPTGLIQWSSASSGEFQFDAQVQCDGLQCLGDARIAGEVRLEETGTGNDYVGFKAPTAITAGSFVWELPAVDGAANQVLVTNASAVLSWANRDEQDIGTGDSPTFAGLTLTGSLDVQDLFLLASTDLSPGATENNYNPTADTAVWRITPNASDTTITGIGPSGGAPDDKRFLILVNLGSDLLILADQSGSSDANNRIITGTGDDVVLDTDETALLWYDTTTNRWRILK